MTSSIIELLYVEDIFKLILYDWVELKEIINLDNALTNKKHREIYFQLLKTIPYKLSSRSKYSLQKSLGWFIKRNMYNLLGELDVNQLSWQNILSFPNINHHLFLNSIEKLKVRFQNGPSSYQRLHECSKLKEIGCFCLTYPLVLPSSVKCMTYYQGSLNDDIISSLNDCPNLISFSSENTNFFALRHPPEHYTEYYFFKNVKTIEIKGKVLHFLKFYSGIVNHCEHILLDGLHTVTINNPQSTPTQPSSLQIFRQFFQNFQYLHTLDFHRILFNSKEFFMCLIRYSSPQLTKLSLMHCIFESFSSINEQDFLELDHYPRRLKSFTLQNITVNTDEAIQYFHLSNLQIPQIHIRAQIKLKMFELILRFIHHELESIHVSFLENSPESVKGMIYHYCGNIRSIHVTL